MGRQRNGQAGTPSVGGGGLAPPLPLLHRRQNAAGWREPQLARPACLTLTTPRGGIVTQVCGEQPAGTFAGSYRLDRLLTKDGQTVAAGTLAGELTTDDGRPLGVGSRRRPPAFARLNRRRVPWPGGPVQLKLLGCRRRPGTPAPP